MDNRNRRLPQPQWKRPVQAEGIVLVSRATKDQSNAADFIAPVDVTSVLMEDFHGAAGASIPAPFAVASTETGGTPVKDFLSNSFAGALKLAGDTTSEAQSVRVDFGDNLIINSGANPVMEARIKVQFNSTDTEFTPDERLVVGLCGAYNATLDSVAAHAWFRIEGASLNLLIESDDGTTDDDDNDSGVDIVDDEWIVLRIDASDLATVRFYANGAPCGELDATDLSGGLQPIVAYQKDAGAEAQVILVDYIKVWADR